MYRSINSNNKWYKFSTLDTLYSIHTNLFPNTSWISFSNLRIFVRIIFNHLVNKTRTSFLQDNLLKHRASQAFHFFSNHLTTKVNVIDGSIIHEFHGYENIDELKCDPTYVHGYRRLPSYSKNNGKETKDYINPLDNIL
jgi:hypothetical protein